MAVDIKIRRGTQAQLPTLDLAEPGFTTDTKNLYMGDGIGNVKIGKDTIIEFTDTPSTYDIGKYLRSTAAGTEWSEMSGGSCDVDIEHIIYVAKNGNDLTASGTHRDPYLTVKHALSTISGSSDTCKYIIEIGPGNYIENNPLFMDCFTYIKGMGGFFSTKIVAGNVNENLIELNNNTSVTNMELNGCTGGTALNATVSGLSVNSVLLITDCNRGLSSTNDDMQIRFSDTNFAGTVNECLVVEGGYCEARGLYILPGTTVETFIKSSGSNTVINANFAVSRCNSLTNCFYADNHSTLNVTGGGVRTCINAIRINNGSTFYGNSFFVGEDTQRNTHIEDLDSIIKLTACEVDGAKLFGPAGYRGDTGLFIDSETNNISAYGDLVVGRPDRSRYSVFGGGRSYTIGMKVFTTDSTASSNSDGGNITDVVEAASSTISGSIVSFQGTAAGHTILFGSAFTEDLKSFGISFYQTVAAVETTKRSFVTEYWNGTNWVECTYMNTSIEEGYSYANEIFIRSNSAEYISCNIGDDWAQKTINSVTTYWFRIRIKYGVTTSPVFRWIKLQPNRFRVNNDGYNTYYGKAKFKQTLLATGNIFGETGGVTNADVDIGSGGSPTGWGHMFKNNQLNGNGDAIYMQANLPRGIFTGSPLTIKIIGHPEQSGTSSNGTIIISVLPIEIQGILEADPNGGLIPVERTLDNTEVLTANAAQTTNVSVPFVVNNKLITVESDPIDISNYYEGDMLAIRVELDDDGDGNKDFIVWTVEISGIKWTHGERV